MRYTKATRSSMHVLLGIALLLDACSVVPPAATSDHHAAREALLAVSWMRSSLEHRFLTEQTYRTASAALDGAIAEPGTAAIEQESMVSYALLPPAVVMDIDETTVDTMEFAARLVVQKRYFDREVATREWPAWLRDPQNGKPVPGAIEFVREARSRGLQVMFVTNRECPLAERAVPGDGCAERAATVQALARLGIADVREQDVWMAGGAERWPADKSSRREAIAKSFRIVMLVGDDLQDFLPQVVAQRLRAGQPLQVPDRFGTRWFLLPNPVYGSWERFVSRPCTQGGARVEAAYECHYRVLEAPAH